MKKRLRKKLRKGEFTEFGFMVKCMFKPGFSSEQLDEFLDQTISFCEANDLGMGGGWGPDGCEFGIAGWPRNRATDIIFMSHSRQVVYDFLYDRPFVKSIDIGPLYDQWWTNWEWGMPGLGAKSLACNCQTCGPDPS